MGGLSKKAFQIESISQDYELPSLKVDGGSLLFKHERLVPGMLEQAMITAEGIVTAYNIMGYDAVAVNRLDLAAGVGNLKYLQSKSTFPWVSANLVDRTTQETLFSPYTITTINKLRIGIIGLTSPGPGNSFSASDRIEIIPWQKSLPSLAKELSRQTDMIILLSNYDRQNNSQIAKILSEINIIIQAGSEASNREPHLANNTLLCQTGKQGKHLGLLHLTWRKSKTWGNNTLGKQLIVKQRELDGINYRYRRTEDRIPVADRENNPSLQSLNKSRQKISEEIKTLQDSIELAAAQGKIPSSYKNRFIAMEITIPDQPAVLKIVEEIKHRVNEYNRNIARSHADEQEETFVGWKSCTECHQVQTESWLKTSHSRAYQTLEKKNQQFNLSCLPCHVTIAMDDRNQVSGSQVKELLTLSEERKQVGCELCHGIGNKHVENPMENRMNNRPKSSVCLGCHSPEHDENFNYEIDIQRIGCSVSQ